MCKKFRNMWEGAVETKKGRADKTFSVLELLMQCAIHNPWVQTVSTVKVGWVIKLSDIGRSAGNQI